MIAVADSRSWIACAAVYVLEREGVIDAIESKLSYAHEVANLQSRDESSATGKYSGHGISAQPNSSRLSKPDMQPTAWNCRFLAIDEPDRDLRFGDHFFTEVADHLRI
jgi:hypothetical protein